MIVINKGLNRLKQQKRPLWPSEIKKKKSVGIKKLKKNPYNLF